MSFDFSVIGDYWPIIAQGFLLTLLICAASCAAGMILGMGLALLRLSRVRALRGLAATYIEVIRNTPFLIQVFLIYFGLPAYGIRLDPLLAGIIALSLYSAAYLAEIIRGAILSVPKGQTDSARALGMSEGQTRRRVIFPQMGGYLIPPLTNQLITLIKESSILSTITVAELTFASQMVTGMAFSPFEMFAVVALLYWVLTASLAAIMGRLERRSSRPEAEASPRTA